MMLNQISPVWPTCVPPLFDAGPSFPNTLAVASQPQLPQSQQGLPGRDHRPGGMQHLCPAREVAIGYLPIFFLLVHIRGHLAL